jgi:phospholipid N-methyltransferase
MSKKQFISEFLKNRKEVGSVTPSSRFLVRKMMDPIDFEIARDIVELGAGSGVMTREILSLAHKDATVYCFEMNSVFCEELNKIKDSRLIVINDSAEKIGEYLAKHNCTGVEAVVSSLPFKVIPADVEERILDEVIRCLKPEGTFSQFHYSRNAKKYKERFSQVESDFTALNVPPAFVYKCKI